MEADTISLIPVSVLKVGCYSPLKLQHQKERCPRYTSAPMSDSGNSFEFHFLMSEKSGRQSQAASQLTLILRFPRDDPGLKEKVP